MPEKSMIYFNYLIGMSKTHTKKGSKSRENGKARERRHEQQT